MFTGKPDSSRWTNKCVPDSFPEYKCIWCNSHSKSRDILDFRSDAKTSISEANEPVNWHTRNKFLFPLLHDCMYSTFVYVIIVKVKGRLHIYPKLRGNSMVARIEFICNFIREGIGLQNLTSLIHMHILLWCLGVEYFFNVKAWPSNKVYFKFWVMRVVNNDVY